MSHSSPAPAELPLCGRVREVTPSSLAARAGLRPGDCLLAINGRRVRDVIDVQFLAGDDSLELAYRRGQRTLSRAVRRRFGDPLGLEFAEPVFDGLRECNNHCPFCFVKQMPAGLRPTLYVQDDDYRYSFLHGSFVTLTNLTEADWDRLAEQRLSPLYVSVHATESALRERLLGHRDAPSIMDQLRRLADLGITIHAQIVVLPGINDGPALERTITDLAGLCPAVASIGVVPVGLTRFQRGPARRHTPEEAEALLEQVQPWHNAHRRERGIGLLYASDEWYLLAGRPIPPAAYYDDFPQLENGIGLTRLLLEEWEERREEVERRPWTKAPMALVCGTLIAPVLRELISDLAKRSGAALELVVVENRFFGPLVTVSGLLTAGDVVAALRENGRSWSRIILPRSMFDSEGLVTLDDGTLEEIGRAAGAPAGFAAAVGEIVAELTR
jgi:putative radical SAM enzyme (TIGR03279 family)